MWIFEIHLAILQVTGSPLVEEFFFTTPAKPFMGKNCDLHRNWDVPFVTHREFQNSSTRGFAARGGIFFHHAC